MSRRDFYSIRRRITARFLTEGEGDQIGFALGMMQNVFLQRLYDGLLARFPQNDPLGETTAPDDALAAMGRDRLIPRGRTEAAPVYARRLIPWLDDHRQRGSAWMLMKQLAGYLGPGFSFRTYDVAGNCFSRDVAGVETHAKGTTWDWDGDTSRWSRFWVIVYPTSAWTTTTLQYGDASPKYGRNLAQWGVVIPREEIATMRSIIATWKPAGTRCVNIIVAFDPASFDPAAPEPDGTWGSFSKVVGGSRVPARLATARYLRGSDVT